MTSRRDGIAREITIATCLTDQQMAVISVADTGPGLPDTLDAEFNPRFASEKGGSSMGVGLSISKRIIEAHGGSLRAENRPEGGAIFSFSLPLTAALLSAA
jgi:two-component system sensor kinase FixL